MRRNKFCRIITLIGCFCSMMLLADEMSAPVKVACIGDSITLGYGIQEREKTVIPRSSAAVGTSGAHANGIAPCSTAP